VVELMAAVGLFNYFNRFNDLLEMEPTKPATAEELEQRVWCFRDRAGQRCCTR